MASENVKQLNIWKVAHKWLAEVSAAHKAKGNSSASMTQLASQAILAIPMPNGNGHLPEIPCRGFWPDPDQVDPAPDSKG